MLHLLFSNSESLEMFLLRQIGAIVISLDQLRTYLFSHASFHFYSRGFEAVKLFIESEQEGTHNLKKMLDHFRDFEKEVQKQLAGFRVRISKKQSKIEEWTAFNNAMQQHYMQVNSCYLSQVKKQAKFTCSFIRIGRIW